MQRVVECKYSFVLSAWRRVVGDRMQWSDDKESAFRALLHLALDRLVARLRSGQPIDEMFRAEADDASLGCLVTRRGQCYEITAIGFSYFEHPDQLLSIDPATLLHEARQTLAVLAAYVRGGALVIEVVNGDGLDRMPSSKVRERGSVAGAGIRKIDIIC